MRTPIIAGLAFAGSLGLPLLEAAEAQTPYQDPQGRFAIDLPARFAFSSGQSGRIQVFQGEDDARLLVAVVGATDRDRVWRLALDEFTGFGVPAPPAGAVTDLEVNGNPARLARYAAGDYTVLLGAVLMRGSGTGIACFTLLNAKAAERWEEPLRRAILSIRIPTAAVVTGL